MLLLYRAPAPGADRGRAVRRWWTIAGRETLLTLAAGVAWMTLNAGFILFLSFGPKLLLERGATPAGANFAVGWASLLSIATVPLGGVLLDRVRRRDAVMAVSLVGSAAACGAFVLGGPAVFWSVLFGLLIAPVAGVVALAGEALAPGSRNTGFGLFYTLFYAGMSLAPVAAGYLVDRRGGAAALWLAASLWLAALPALWALPGAPAAVGPRGRRGLSRGRVSHPLAAVLDAPVTVGGAWPSPPVLVAAGRTVAQWPAHDDPQGFAGAAGRHARPRSSTASASTR